MTAIIIITFNIHPDVFILQIEAIKRFCRDEAYVIEIIDNSTDEEIAKSIRYHARLRGCHYTRTMSGTGDSSYSHSHAANFAYGMLCKKYDLVAYFDHDLVPVKEFSIKEILSNKLMAGLAQDKEHKYFWPGLFMFDNMRVDQALVNFSPSPGLDTGGELWKLIDKYGLDECVFFDEAYHQNPHFTNGGQYGNYTMLCQGTFMHFVNASNWNPVPGQRDRLNSLINIALEKMEQKEKE